LNEYGSVMGSASIVVMDETTDMVWMALKCVHFFKHESCGKCTPCREGTVQIGWLLEKIIGGGATEADLKKLEDLCHYIKVASMCGLGQMASNPVLSTMKYFRHEYEIMLNNGSAVTEPARVGHMIREVSGD